MKQIMVNDVKRHWLHRVGLDLFDSYQLLVVARLDKGNCVSLKCDSNAIKKHMLTFSKIEAITNAV